MLQMVGRDAEFCCWFVVAGCYSRMLRMAVTKLQYCHPCPIFLQLLHEDFFLFKTKQIKKIEVETLQKFLDVLKLGEKVKSNEV